MIITNSHGKYVNNCIEPSVTITSSCPPVADVHDGDEKYMIVIHYQNVSVNQYFQNFLHEQLSSAYAIAF